MPAHATETDRNDQNFVPLQLSGEYHGHPFREFMDAHGTPSRSFSRNRGITLYIATVYARIMDKRNPMKETKEYTLYNDTVMDHFLNPRNMGDVSEARWHW